MPLLQATLKAEILKVTDPTNPSFVGWPASPTDAAANWAAAAGVFFGQIVVPPTLPATIVAGQAAFAAAFAAQLPGNGVGALTQGFEAFATIVAASTIVPVAVPPPPGTLIIVPGPPSSSAEAPADLLATTVFAWAKTGSYGVPPTPPVPGTWS